MRIEDLNVKKSTAKAGIPESAGFDIEAGFIFSACGSVIEGLAFQCLKFRLDFDIVTNVLIINLPLIIEPYLEHQYTPVYSLFSAQLITVPVYTAFKSRTKANIKRKTLNFHMHIHIQIKNSENDMKNGVQ